MKQASCMDRLQEEDRGLPDPRGARREAGGRSSGGTGLASLSTAGAALMELQKGPTKALSDLTRLYEFLALANRPAAAPVLGYWLSSPGLFCSPTRVLESNCSGFGAT